MTPPALRLVTQPAPAAAYTPDLAAIQADVEALAAMRRDTAGAGERAAAAWVAARLAQAGGAEAHVQPYRGRATYGWSFAAHPAAGAAATVRGGPLGAAATLAALWSLERDASGRAPWRRRGPGGDRGANAAARVPARGARRATVVLVAHLDAAHTGLAWHPAVTRAGAGSRLRRHSVDPFLAPVAAALLAGGAAGLSGSRRSRRMRAGAAGVLVLAAGLNLDIARSATVPGANDNATGVAVVLDLVRALVAEPLEHVEVVAVCPGGEESGMGGFAAFLRARASSLHPASTLVVGLDTLGSGTPDRRFRRGLGRHAPLPRGRSGPGRRGRRAGRAAGARALAPGRLDGPRARAPRGRAGDLAAVDGARLLPRLPPSQRRPRRRRPRVRRPLRADRRRHRARAGAPRRRLTTTPAGGAP